jgi:hypothetical protein
MTKIFILSWTCTDFEIGACSAMRELSIFLHRRYVCCTVVSARVYPHCHGVQVTMGSVHPSSLYCNYVRAQALGFSLLCMVPPCLPTAKGDSYLQRECLVRLVVVLKVKVKFTSRLAVYRQSIRLGVKPLETHDQRFFFN